MPAGTDLVSVLIGVVTGLAALAGALGSQAIAAWLRRRDERQTYAKDRRLAAYSGSGFTADIELLQLQLDRRATRPHRPGASEPCSTEHVRRAVLLGGPYPQPLRRPSVANSK